MPKHDPDTLPGAAWQATKAMTKLYASLGRVAEATGRLMAMADNADQAEALSSMRSDTAYQLVSNLYAAYGELADYLRASFKDR